MGEAISLRAPNRPATAGQVVKQIETPRSPAPPFMLRLRADREAKRVPRGSDTLGPGHIDRETLASRTPIREGSEDHLFARQAWPKQRIYLPPNSMESKISANDSSLH